MEQELGAAQLEISDLRKKLLEKEELVQGLESTMMLYRVKSDELEAVLAVNDPSEHGNQLKLKILQNAELTTQLQVTRRQLDEGRYMQNSVEKELWHAQATVKRLGEERRGHQKMVIQMSDVLRTLGAIDVEYDKTQEASSWSSPERSLDNIKMKIHALENDRQRLIMENRELQTQLFEKDIDLDDYLAQAAVWEESKKDHDNLVKEKTRLTSLCEKQAATIKSMEKSLAASANVKFPVKDIVYRHNGEREDPDIEAVLQSDGSTVVVPSTASVSRVTDDPAHLNGSPKQQKTKRDDDVASFLSIESPDGVVEELQRAAVTSEGEVQKLKQDLQTTVKKLKSSQKKQELHEKMLRDVIFHYKQLQKEHDAATARLAEKRPLRPKDKNNLPSTPVEQTKVGSNEGLEKSPTFDTAESSHAQSLSATDAGSGSEIQYQMSDPEDYPTEEDYRRLENECVRLEHQYEDAVARITNLEEDLASVKQELAESQSKNSDKQKEIGDLQLKLDLMDADFKTALEKSLRLQEDLHFAEEQAVQARKKRDERELDLLDVIDQYKKLSGENEHNLQKVQIVENQLDQTEAMKKSVERELGLTKRQIKRNDLVYENMRMDQKVQTYEEQIESMERYLKQARAEAIRSKEDAKCMRKLLNSCNVNFQQLQERYDELARAQAVAEKERTQTKRASQLNEKMEVYRRTQEYAKANRRLHKAQVSAATSRVAI